MSIFGFSEQGRSDSSESEQAAQSEPEEKEKDLPQKQEMTDEELERLKEDARVYGWEFDEAREVFRPLPAM